MLGLEKKVFVTAALFMATLFGLVAYSIFGLGIKLPGCVTLPQAFSKGEIIRKSDRLVEVHVVARMWSFDPAIIKVKPGTTLDIYLASVDVTHGFLIENTNVNLMAVPGAVNYARVTLKEPGLYHILCHEYCGVGHQNMTAMLVVGDELEQADILRQAALGIHQNDGEDTANQEADLPGKTLYTTKGCVACHSTDGTRGTGPSFKGLYGRNEKMSTGLVVAVDDAYIIESIKDPTAKIVDTFQPVMPKLPVSDDEIQQIIAYIKTLKE